MNSMRDVARLAGVSVATVSAVINGKGTVSSKRTQQVLKAMEALDYHPDQIARSLRVGRSNTLGMIVPDISNPFFSEILRSFQERCETEGWSVIVCDSNDNPERERQHLASLYAKRVDGVVLATSGSQAAYDRLTLRRFPIVFIDSVPSGAEQGAVVVDNVEGAYVATKHLIELGHRRIAVINGLLQRSPGADRMAGFQKAMQEAGLPVPQEYVQQGGFHLDGGYTCGEALMRLDVPPTAIFSCNNRMSLGLLHALSELKINCPDVVSVIGFDDADWATSFHPHLTCIAQPVREIGTNAAEMLLRKIEDAGREANGQLCPNLVLRAELRLRESTKNVTDLSTFEQRSALEGVH